MPQNIVSQIFLAVLLFVLLGLLLWRNSLNQINGPLKRAPATDQRFTGFMAQQFGHTGDLQWTLTGNAVQHNTGERGYTMQDPLLTVEDRQQKAPPWHLSAPLGTANEALTRIHLSGGVTGRRAANDRQGSLHFTTESLMAAPQDQTAQSVDPTQFSEQNGHQKTVWQSDSAGFLLNYQNQRLEQPHVHDRFLPRLVPNAPDKIPDKTPDNAQENTKNNAPYGTRRSPPPIATHRIGAQP